MGHKRKAAQSPSSPPKGATETSKRLKKHAEQPETPTKAAPLVLEEVLHNKPLPPRAVDPSAKSKRKDKSKKDKKSRDKSKKSSSKDGNAAPARAGKENEGRKPESEEGFVQLTTRVLITLPPAQTTAPLSGVQDTLNAMLFNYVPQLQGVVLCYNNIRLIEEVGAVVGDSPFVQFWVEAMFVLWRPVVDMELQGQITIQSPDHIGLLLYNTFNVSIPAELIDKTRYEWRSAAEGGYDSAANSGSMGEWVEKESGKGIDSLNNGWLSFKVAEVLRASEVLSLTGYLT
ncbi:hypothetical protein EV182_002320 [Spiromyces aspiralis]|uniref:Uncharacterized protein n=1 Tax=Spiromyces aspiralis TaxID=68401 RepID=A0ACC1HEB5_9FUNG|nr:hypothetical protein EV182_002320 [Spiromyces aspiralis]